MQQTENSTTTTYTLDLVGELTQVLADGTNTYLYGNGRIAQYSMWMSEKYRTTLGDALGSVRQLVDASGSVTLAKGYQPYGEVLDSAGNVTTSYGFTNEWTENTGLVYLRARYYEPGMGRFMTKDTWGGDMNQPMSYNAWLYGYANPVNLTDPSGFDPCSLELYRYCVLTGKGFRGVVIDVLHWADSKRMARDLLDVQFRDAIRKSFATVSMHSLLIEKIPYSWSYYTNIPSGLSQETLVSIGLGIFMDFQFGLESFEAIDPFCYTVAGAFHSHRCSSFSNEDLPSDYLGFVVYVKYPGWSIVDLANSLGGGEGSDDLPPENACSWWDAYRCTVLGLCGDDNPYNKCWTFKVLDASIGGYVHKPWPPEFIIAPIGPGEYWAKTLSDFAQPVPTP